MEELLSNFIEEAKKDKSKLLALKQAAVKSSQYELAANLRALETELFPESEEVKSAKKRAEKLNLVFRMVELNIPNEIAWLVERTVKRYWKRRGNFDLKDAAELIDMKDKIFGNDRNQL